MAQLPFLKNIEQKSELSTHKKYLRQKMQDELLQRVVSEIAGREREIVNDFCKAFIAQKCIEGFDAKFLFDHFVFNVKHDFKDGSKYWFSLRQK